MSNKSKDPFRTPSPKLEAERQSPPPPPRPSRTRSSMLQDANITPSNLTNRFERIQSSDSLSSTSSLLGGHYASHHLLRLFSSDTSSVDTEHSDSALDVPGETETGSVHSEESNDSCHSSDVESIPPKREELDEIDTFFATSTPNIDTAPANEKELLSYIGDDVSSIASSTSYASSIPHIQPEPWAQRLRPRTHFAPVTYSDTRNKIPFGLNVNKVLNK